MTTITGIDPGMARVLERAKRAEIKMRQRWLPLAPPKHIDTKAKVLRNGKTKLVRRAIATARYVWPATKYSKARGAP